MSVAIHFEDNVFHLSRDTAYTAYRSCRGAQEFLRYMFTPEIDDYLDACLGDVIILIPALASFKPHQLTFYDDQEALMFRMLFC